MQFWLKKYWVHTLLAAIFFGIIASLVLLKWHYFDYNEVVLKKHATPARSFIGNIGNADNDPQNNKSDFANDVSLPVPAQQIQKLLHNAETRQTQEQALLTQMDELQTQLEQTLKSESAGDTVQTHTEHALVDQASEQAVLDNQQSAQQSQVFESELEDFYTTQRSIEVRLQIIQQHLQ